PATLAVRNSSRRMILVTGFEPFAGHVVNPSAEVAKALDGRVVGSAVVRSAVLPVHHAEAIPAVVRLVEESDPLAIVHLGLAGGRARIALERVAVNVMDFETPDNAGHLAQGESCVTGGPAAYLATLPLDAMLAALLAEGVPAYVSTPPARTSAISPCTARSTGWRRAITRPGPDSCTCRCRPRWWRPAGSISPAWTSG